MPVSGQKNETSAHKESCHKHLFDCYYTSRGESKKGLLVYPSIFHHAYFCYVNITILTMMSSPPQEPMTLSRIWSGLLPLRSVSVHTFLHVSLSAFSQQCRPLKYETIYETCNIND